MSKRITKEKTLREFCENAMVAFQIECNICGNEVDHGFNHMAIDASEALDEFKNELWSDGWRFSMSKTYGHIGIHCAECHAKRNSPDI
jgi:hypothetical protein